jgi:hypothetical protein
MHAICIRENLYLPTCGDGEPWTRPFRLEGAEVGLLELALGEGDLPRFGVPLASLIRPGDLDLLLLPPVRLVDPIFLTLEQDPSTTCPGPKNFADLKSESESESESV